MTHTIKQLITKYSTPVPRYTSYPTAPHFAEVSAADRQKITEYLFHRNNQARDISLYLHLPFCKSLCWYCGCNTVISRQQEVSDVYLSYLEKELKKLTTLMNADNTVVQLHYGGGTPTYLSDNQLLKLGNLLSSYLHIASDAEAGVEIDPRTLSMKKAAALRKTGFNRASIGIQDVNDDVQKAINRVQPSHVNREAFKVLRDAGFTSINADLIVGLPLQTLQSFRDTIRETISYKPDRFAVFNYAHVPWMKPAQKLLDRHPRPDAYLKFEMMEMLQVELSKAGYVPIGMDHFALPNDDLVIAQLNGTLQRNFQGYSTFDDVDLYGIGVSSISQVGSMYIQNTPDLTTYYAHLDDGKLPFHKSYHLTEEDEMRKWIIMRTMCDLQLDFRKVAHRFDIHFRTYFEDEWDRLREFENEGFVELSDSKLTVTEQGKTFIRNIVSVFDAYLKQGEDNNTRYSKSL